MSTFDEKENEILPSLDVGQRKRPSILKSVSNAVLPLNKKKKLFFSTIQYQEVFADGTSRIFYQSINDISASESVVEPSKIFPNDDMDEESSGDDLLNKTKYFSNDDLSLDSQSDSIPKIVVNSQPSQPSQPQSELMSMTHIDPGENDTMESINTQTSSSHLSKRLSSSDSMEKLFALSKTDTFSTAEISLRRSSSSSLKISHAIPEPETQQGVQIPDLTHFVAAGEDHTLESINTQNSSSNASKSLSSSNNIEKSFALSENDTFSTPKISLHRSSSPFVEISHAIPESETQLRIQIPDLTHFVAAGEDDTQESISTQNSSKSICDDSNLTPRTENAEKKWPELGEVIMAVDNKSFAPDKADSIVSMAGSQSTLKELSDNKIVTEADQASLDITNIELSFCASCSFVEASHSPPEPETQQGIQIPDLTHFVAAGEDHTLESINTQNFSSNASKSLSSSKNIEKSFALSENDTFSTPQTSHHRSSSPFVEISHAIPESETQLRIQIPDLTHFVAAGEDDTQESINTQNSSSHVSKSLSLSNLTAKSFSLSENDTSSTSEISLGRSSSPFVEISRAIPEPETQLRIQIPDLTHFVAAGEDDTQESINTQNSSSHVSKRLSSSIVIEKSATLSERDTSSTSKISLHRSSSPFVKISHAIPECEMLPSHRILELSRFAPNGRDETLFPSHNTLPINNFSRTGHGSIKSSCVWHYFGEALSIHIQYRPITHTLEKILQFSWVLGSKNGAPFVVISDSGDQVVVGPESRLVLIIIEHFINTELSRVQKSLDSISSKSELFKKVNKILRRIAILATELLDLWQRYDGKLLSVSENSFRCGFNIDRLKKRALLVIHLDLQNYLNQKLSVHLRAHSDDRLFYTPITRKILECCQAVDPSVNKYNYIRMVVKSAEDFISDYRKREARIRCAYYHSEKLRAIISAPMPDIDRATLVEKVVEVLASSYNVPLYSNDLNFRRKIRHNSRKNVEKPGKKSS